MDKWIELLCNGGGIATGVLQVLLLLLYNF